MAQNQQHGDQSIGSGHTQDGIQGTPPGTEGATSGQGVDRGQSKQSTQDKGNQQGNRQGSRQGSSPSSGGTETYQRNDLFEDQAEDAGMSEQQRADSQQSAQREGMGSHQRANRQGSDVERGDEDFNNLHSDKDPNRER
jgi:hypothetical protein